MKEEIKKYIIVGTIVIAEIAFVLYFILGPQSFRPPKSKIPKPVEKAISFINENLLIGTGLKAELDSEVTKESGLYKFLLNVGGQRFWTYVTLDGKLLFPQGIELEKGLPIPPQAQAPQQPLAFDLEGEPVLGDEKAPVILVEFSDFECPFCAKYSAETFPEIKKNYVDTGQVKVVFKNFPIKGSLSKLAAQASECALEQGKFWEYKQVLFLNQKNLSKENLKKYAKDLNLKEDQFNQCLDSEKYKDEVERDLKEGQVAGVTGTPTFFINGQKLTGALPYSEFQKVIEANLQK